MDWQDFDLLGDPIPAGFGGRGRPPHVANDEKARIIMVLAALGKTKGQIAEALGVTQPTLNKHYFSKASRYRLRVKEARQRVEAKLLAKLYAGAEEGNVAAIKALWDRLDKADLKAAQMTAAQAPAPQAAQEKLGKKAAATLAAHTAHEATTWADLLPN